MGRTPHRSPALKGGATRLVRGAWLAAMLGCAVAGAQEHPHPTARPVPLQPLAQHVRRLETALTYLGQPFGAADREAINDALAMRDEAAAVAALERILDAHVLLDVQINPESRVKVAQGAATPALVEGGTRLFLVKVANQAGVTAPLRVSSPNSGRVSVSSRGSAEPPQTITRQTITERWADITIYDRSPMRPRLSGLGLEYAILEVYSRDRGQRAAEISVDVGQGTQDIGFRNDVSVLFTAAPAYEVALRIHDERARPAMASLLIRDGLGRLYPAPSKRLAPDLPFQPQIYRADGERIHLPAGEYTVRYSGGPEYLTGERRLTVSADRPARIDMALERWIDPAARGWYSGDHHVHAAGCSHYQDPTQGVEPDDMMRQLLGEGLNVGSVLTWGPCYYYQKKFFSGNDHPLSRADRVMHYDLEVSGFPSSHAGHLVLLGLKDQDYPGTKRIEDWPSWDLPILKWARAQGAVVGFAHSGWGLAVKTSALPNDEIPPFDGIGANEFIVDVTHDAVDFISTVDTPHVWELNMWYHVLSAGFRTRISGETDFPCIYDERVGLGRTYTHLPDGLTFRGWLDALRSGRSYVSDGRSHLMNFRVNGTEAGTGNSELQLPGPATARVDIDVAALLAATPVERIRNLPYEEKPYWDVERARIGGTRTVPVEIVVNGEAVARQEIEADGRVRTLRFDVPLSRSAWVAARILPSAHTNPVFVIVDAKPIRSRRSARWCLASVDQCWTQKAPAIAPAEREAARKAYDHARDTYRRLASESDR